MRNEINLISHFSFVSMRLDLFLKSSRLIARRSLAQKFCDAGFIKVNNLTAKSSREVKPDDELEIKKHNRLIKIRVSQIPDKKQISRQDSVNLYEIISEEILEDEL
jgi:ribosomal 50S subunit-recycling heat shock protein